MGGDGCGEGGLDFNAMPPQSQPLFISPPSHPINPTTYLKSAKSIAGGGPAMGYGPGVGIDLDTFNATERR